jgi:transposase
MAPHLSQEMRNAIVRWKFVLGKSDEEMAALAGCSEHTVREVIRLHNEFGVVSNPIARLRGRTRALSTEDINYIASILDANPTLYLDEIQDQLSEYRGIDVSIATLCRTLHRIALSKKKISMKAMERNELL